MFDMWRLSDVVGDLVGSATSGAGPGRLIQQLGELGIDPAQLQGVGPDQLVTLLSEHGLDLSLIDPDHVAMLTEQIGIEVPGGDILSQLGDRSPPG